MRGYNLPRTKGLWEEGVIIYFLDENICRKRMIKFRDVLSFKQEMKNVDPSFKGFYLEEYYKSRLDKYIQNFDKVSSQVLEDIRKRVYLKSSDQNIIVEFIDDEDQGEILEWAHQRKKKQKMVEIPQKAKEKDLRIYQGIINILTL